MKQQNNHKKTKHYTAYEERMTTQDRVQKAIKEAAGDCWWIEAYLKGVYRVTNTKLTKKTNNGIRSHRSPSNSLYTNKRITYGDLIK